MLWLGRIQVFVILFVLFVSSSLSSVIMGNFSCSIFTMLSECQVVKVLNFLNSFWILDSLNIFIGIVLPLALGLVALVNLILCNPDIFMYLSCSSVVIMCFFSSWFCFSMLLVAFLRSCFVLLGRSRSSFNTGLLLGNAICVGSFGFFLNILSVTVKGQPVISTAFS